MAFVKDELGVPPSPMRPGKILLVEDDLGDVELTVNALENDGIKNSIVTVRDGVDALEYLHASNELPIFILMDIKMPRKGGIETLREIRSDKRLRLIPVIIFTSSRDRMDIINSYNYHANSYVVKPIDYRKFIENVADIGNFWAVFNVAPNKGGVL